MYIPKYFKVTNVDGIFGFVQENSFGSSIAFFNIQQAGAIML
jgi:hypothetical protein